MRQIVKDVLFAYVPEGILALLVFIIFELIFGFDSIHKFVYETSTTWITVLFSLSALSISAWGILWAFLRTEFGEWMISLDRVDQLYSRAFVASTTVFFGSAVLMVFTKYCNNVTLSNISSLAAIYSALNVFTMLKNAFGISKLYSMFQFEKRKIEHGEP